MEKIKSYLLAGLATFALASCDDSFNDWSEQPGNPQGEAVAFGNGSVAAVDVIDFAQITESTDSVTIVTSQRRLHLLMLHIRQNILCESTIRRTTSRKRKY